MKKGIMKGLSVIVALILLMSNNVQAADKWDKAEKAYRSFLKKYQSSYVVPDNFGEEGNTESYKYCSSYTIKDMNGDGVPELLTIHNTNLKNGDIYIFTYKNGKVQKVKNGKVSIASSASGGWYQTYFCKKNHLHVERDGGFPGALYRVYRLSSKGKLVKYLQWEYNIIENKETFKKNGKKIIAGDFNKLYKKCRDREKQKGIAWKDNCAVKE